LHNPAIPVRVIARAGRHVGQHERVVGKHRLRVPPVIATPKHLCPAAVQQKIPRQRMSDARKPISRPASRF